LFSRSLVLLPPDATAEDVERFREAMGFNDPFIVQYGRFLKGALQGDFGQSIRFRESDVRSMGRSSTGVIAIHLKKDDHVSSMNIISGDSAKTGRLLVVMENGYGKQTSLSEYKVQKRGGSGI